jgi:hypothetical protein
VKTSEKSWLYFSAYFISFIPPMLIFFIFVVPSKLYMKAFKQSFKNLRRFIHISHWLIVEDIMKFCHKTVLTNTKDTIYLLSSIIDWYSRRNIVQWLICPLVDQWLLFINRS